MVAKILEMSLGLGISLGLGAIAAKFYAALVYGVLAASMNPISGALTHALTVSAGS
jgi:hypothetical protein